MMMMMMMKELEESNRFKMVEEEGLKAFLRVSAGREGDVDIWRWR
jgi:hypothetical protein